MSANFIDFLDQGSGYSYCRAAHVGHDGYRIAYHSGWGSVYADSLFSGCTTERFADRYLALVLARVLLAEQLALL